jgi:hypothetical protein
MRAKLGMDSRPPAAPTELRARMVHASPSCSRANSTGACLELHICKLSFMEPTTSLRPSLSTEQVFPDSSNADAADHRDFRRGALISNTTSMRDTQGDAHRQ